MADESTFDYLPGKTSDDDGFAISSKLFKKLLGPGVYVAETDTEVLYVGYSANLMGRMSSTMHAALKAALEIDGCEIMVMTTRSPKVAKDWESYLIAANQPRFNKAGKTKTSSAYKSLQDNYPSFDRKGSLVIG